MSRFAAVTHFYATRSANRPGFRRGAATISAIACALITRGRKGRREDIKKRARHEGGDNDTRDTAVRLSRLITPRQLVALDKIMRGRRRAALPIFPK